MKLRCKFVFLIAFLALTLIVFGCSSDSDDGKTTTDGDTSDTEKTDSDKSSTTPADGDSTTTPADGDSTTTPVDGDVVAVTGKVIVTYGGKEFPIALNDVVVGSINGKEAYNLKTLLSGSMAFTSMLNKSANFEATDGYDPSTNDKCKSVLPVVADDFKFGWIEDETQDLVWEDTSNFPGCMKVTNLKYINVIDGGKVKTCDPQATLGFTGKPKADCDKVVGVCENAFEKSDAPSFGPCSDDPDCCCDLSNKGTLYPEGSYSCENNSCILDGYCDPNCPDSMESSDCYTGK